MHAQAQKALLVGDILAAGVAGAALTQWLPPIAAGLTILWTGLRIYDWFEERYKKEKKDGS